MSLPTNIDINGSIENNNSALMQCSNDKCDKCNSCMNGTKLNNYYQMNHSANSKEKSINNSNNHSDHKNNNEEEVLNENNNKIDTEIKEKEIKIEDDKNEPQNDEDLEDWQILKQESIEGEKVKLVPYQVNHVETYNEWLNDPYIQQMTCTEPYSLEQEYEYQKEWNDDETKYIFIILDKTLSDLPMAGDINLFITQNIYNDNNKNEQMAELNIMIAEEKSRRKGLAIETLQIIIKWAQEKLEIKTFVAKIQHDNHGSIKLFKKIGFVQYEYIEAFKEYTFTLTLKDDNNNNNIKKHHSPSLRYTD
mmetsp:Transcript_39219/g.34745  ORF Transcript_39219/g.34745 Transcript_39219/m.34745 type:complete len:306 (-) Transcript_39219:3-920(-)